MKKTYFHALATLALLSSCGDNRTNGPDGWYDDEDSLAISQTAPRADSTLYGTMLESGMGSFVLRTVKGDTLELRREGSNIAGSTDHEGDRFAVIVSGRDTNDPALEKAINLTEVEKFSKDYTIVNGQLVLEGDTVEIEALGPNGLKATGKKIHKLPK
ncbi:MAG: hypothetical protein J6N92_04545 [Alloprevotella sp.]|nr:hypothetical protein [Alloprevotella sp.]